MGILQVDNLKLSINKSLILRDISLEVPPGTIHAVVGPNGAGKSTLAYAIMGVPGYVPEHGRITFKDRVIDDLEIDERGRMGMSLAWQEPARFEGLTVRSFLSAGAADKSEAALRDALEGVALDPDDYLDRAVDDGLSGGERKRIELASIVVMRPSLMIMDEPDSGIDVDALTHIFELLQQMKESGTTILLVTHSREVLGQADTASLVCCGMNVKEGPAGDIKGYFEDRCIPCPVHNPELVEEG